MTSTTSTVAAPSNAATNTRPKKLYTSRKASSLPVSTVEYLKAWMLSPEHIAHPYPTDQEKRDIMAETGINQKQLTNWFVNNRKRFWKPRVKKAGVTPAIPPSTSTTTSTRSSSRLSSPTINQLPIKPERVASSPTSVSKTVNKFCPTQARVSLLNAYVYHQKGEDAHAVSEGSSAGSDDDSVGASTIRSSSSSTATPFNNKGLSIVSPTKIARNVSLVNLPTAANEGYRRNEEVEVHILRPEGSTSSSVEDPLPTIRDLTIKSSVPENRILATFKCPISYTIPKEIEHDKKKVQTRRDGEVLKMKKHYLKLYLATRGIHSVSTPVVTSAEKKVLPPTSTLPSSTLVHSVSEVTLSDAATVSVSSTSSVVSSSSMPYKKRFSALLTHTTDLIDQDPPRRKRARTSSGSFVEGDEEWKQLCTTADSYFCDSLPSMEEASRMFGYA